MALVDPREYRIKHALSMPHPHTAYFVDILQSQQVTSQLFVLKCIHGVKQNMYIVETCVVVMPVAAQLAGWKGRALSHWWNLPNNQETMEERLHCPCPG